jgi:hypothetical protein
MQGKDPVINEPLVDKLVEEIKAAGVRILMADPITEFNDGDENNRGHAKLLNRAFRMIALKAEVAVVYWAHTGKPGASDRPDWYRDDMYAQRGSSQNIGSLKTAATHWPIVRGDTVREQWNWMKRMKSADHPTVPNLTAVTVVKVKNHPRQWHMAYELVSSAENPDIAVAEPIPLDMAEDRANAAASGAVELTVSTLTDELVRRLGPGMHKRPTVNRAMKGVTGWPNDCRANRHSELLSGWAAGLTAHVKGAAYRVRVELPRDGESTSFTLHIREV